MKTLELDSAELSELWSAAKKSTSQITKTVVGGGIAEVMRAACPVPGGACDKLMTVILKPGSSVHPHEHDRHLIVFYPEACDPIVVEGKQIDLQAGRIIHVPPGTTHGVPAVTRTRLSVAMLVSEK